MTMNGGSNRSICQGAGRYGTILFPAHDLYIGRSIALYGEYAEFEAALFRRLMRPQAVAVDVGANIGCHTLALAAAATRVVAFEPQRRIFQLLCANLALNEIDNVDAIHAGAGAVAGRIRLAEADLTRPANFGRFELSEAEVGVDTAIMPIDALALARCDLIKCDVEGMETEVLLGARQTIARHRPVLYVENDRPAEAGRLTALLLLLHYRIWWHTPTYFNSDNFNGNPVDVFYGLRAFNFLCLPVEHAADQAELYRGLVEIKRPSSAWPPIILLP